MPLTKAYVPPGPFNAFRRCASLCLRLDIRSRHHQLTPCSQRMPHEMLSTTHARANAPKDYNSY